MSSENLLPVGDSILAFESHCIPMGFSATNALLKSFESKLIEASPVIPGRLLTIVNMREEDLERGRDIVQSLLKRNLFRIIKLNEARKDTLEAFYGLKKQNLKDCLIVAKSESTVDLIKLCNDILLDNGIDVFDIRSTRGLGESAILYATIDDSKRLLAESLLEGLELLDTFSIISDLHKDIVDLFEI